MNNEFLHGTLLFTPAVDTQYYVGVEVQHQICLEPVSAEIKILLRTDTFYL